MQEFGGEGLQVRGWSSLSSKNQKQQQALHSTITESCLSGQSHFTCDQRTLTVKKSLATSAVLQQQHQRVFKVNRTSKNLHAGFSVTLEIMNLQVKFLLKKIAKLPSY